MSEPAFTPEIRTPKAIVPTRGNSRPLVFILLGALLLFFALLVPTIWLVTRALRAAAAQTAAENGLRNIALGLFQYHDFNTNQPFGDPSTPPRLSWRVQIAQDIEFGEGNVIIFSARWDEPWDSYENKKLHGSMLQAFAAPGTERALGQTQYLGILNPPFPDGESRQHNTFLGNGFLTKQLDLCADGKANVIMFVEADRSVPWMKPEDLTFDSQNPKAGLGHVRSGGFLAVMADGSVRLISNKTDDETLRRLILRDDGQPVGN